MSKIDNPTEIRKLLLSHGYTPLANLDKRCVLTGWPKLAVDETLIDSKEWTRGKHRATGLRVDPPLGVIDPDIVEADVLNRVLDRWIAFLPDIFDGTPLLCRGTDASCKVAFFVRIAKPFGRKATRVYRRPGGDAQQVEIFGGKQGRQFGAFGAHKTDRDGNTVSSYVWEYDSPVDVKVEDLPQITPEQCDELIRIADAELAASGMELVPAKGGMKDGETVYDLTEDMVFECEDGDYTLAELREAAKTATTAMRCSASWWDASSENTTRCMARMTKNGLMVFDHATGQKHYEAGLKPPSEEQVMAALAELKQAAEAQKSEIEDPEDGDDVTTAAAKLRGRYLLWTTAKGPMVVRVTARALGEAMSLSSFQAKFRRFRVMQGRTVIKATDLWLDGCVSIDDGAMRPDIPTRFHAENDRQFLNVYWKPEHTARGGSADMGVEFMAQIAPDAEERRWFLQWLAFKFQNPGIPGPSIINVANDRFGTGRGTFETLLRKLMGYIKTVPYTDFIGSTYQSQYNDWMFDSLIVVVNETQRLDGKSKYSVGHDAYEVIKERLDPRASPRRLARKGLFNYEALSFCCYVINVNSIDAIPLPANDRRCFVLSNGDPRDPEWWEKLNAWMEDPANIAAFAAYLLSINLKGYKPYATPPMTQAKLDMAEAGQSMLDRAVDEALFHYRAKGGDLFSMKHIIDAISGIEQLDGIDERPANWKSIVGRIVMRRNVYRIGVRNGLNWHPKFGEGRYATYAWTKEGKIKWSKAEPPLVKRELERCGPLDGSGASVFKDLLVQASQRAN